MVMHFQNLCKHGGILLVSVVCIYQGLLLSVTLKWVYILMLSVLPLTCASLEVIRKQQLVRSAAAFLQVVALAL